MHLSVVDCSRAGAVHIFEKVLVSSQIGAKLKNLGIDHMLEVFPSQTTHANLIKIEKEWSRQLKANPKTPSVGCAIIRAYWRQLLVISVTGFFA